MSFKRILLVSAMVVGLSACGGSKQCELNDLHLLSSGHQLDDASSIVFYGFSFSGNKVDYSKEYDRIPHLVNTSEFGNKKCFLRTDIYSDSPITISSHYAVQRSYQNEDGEYCYELVYNGRIKPFQEFPFPIIGAVSEVEDAYTVSMIMAYTISPEGPVVQKKLFVVGYPETQSNNSNYFVPDSQKAFVRLTRALVNSAEGVSLVYKDTIVSPIRNLNIWNSGKVNDCLLIDLQ
jgi:hypothetical protein